MSTRTTRGGPPAPDGHAMPAEPPPAEVAAVRSKLAHLLALGALRCAAARSPSNAPETKK